jgi:hypothetical protein
MISPHLVNSKSISNHIFGLEETMGNDNRGGEDQCIQLFRTTNYQGD